MCVRERGLWAACERGAGSALAADGGARARTALGLVLPHLLDPRQPAREGEHGEIKGAARPIMISSFKRDLFCNLVAQERG